MNQEQIKILLDSSAGKALVQFLTLKIIELDSCRTELTDDREIAVEMKARERAVEKLQEILEPFGLVKEMKKPEFDPKEFIVD